MKRAFRLGLLVTAAAAALLLSDCRTDDVPDPTSPTTTLPLTGPRAVSLATSHTAIPADGISSALITANCTIGGAPAFDNLAVRFTTDYGNFSLNGVTPIDSGSETRIYDTLTGNGAAQIYILSETFVETATVAALFGMDATDSVQVSFVRTPSNVGSLELTVSPTQGAAPLTITAFCTAKSYSDENLSHVGITFTCSDPGAVISIPTVLTGSDGKAVTIISNITQTATVTATTGLLWVHTNVRITS